MLLAPVGERRRQPLLHPVELARGPRCPRCAGQRELAPKPENFRPQTGALAHPIAHAAQRGARLPRRPGDGASPEGPTVSGTTAKTLCDRSNPGTPSPLPTKEDHMFVRVSTFQGPPEDIDEDIAYSKANILPTARKMAGWRGVISLADRGT